MNRLYQAGDGATLRRKKGEEAVTNLAQRVLFRSWRSSMTG